MPQPCDKDIAFICCDQPKQHKTVLYELLMSGFRRFYSDSTLNNWIPELRAYVWMPEYKISVCKTVILHVFIYLGQSFTQTGETRAIAVSDSYPHHCAL